MNREIKFRCWIKPYYKFDKCKKDYRMIYPHLEKDDWYVIDCESQTLMDGEGGKISDYKMYLQQFTGLKDKNGKDIYDGDIIKQEFDGKTWIYEIITPNTGTQNFYRICRYRDFRTDEYGQFEYGDFYLQENTGELHESKDYEVIGNIFENPELIK